ncbi:putative Alkyl hydroperoxide reductase/ Thiol specific antioxidant/ Mal allergen [Nitrospina gracilis 3/211]|uniref:Putative Alkyl hydroperoxide reductase/ Thiol specific antioxidant/ Mal allergen n=1 Tax=Nitrospina gracilis (strain 3/211) TaxID=1266370 RepID=M1YXU1_NITG3|nr:MULTISPECIES: deiodinase-like protein [Nitrospina]MCF8723441.1 peroxiredoxin [Nitrospina sp. Nb-3]CCQ90506.1 putative Alkyl hydroperoxide reductase/ Thiol specific antioxidant/ Mal allergen [Nitrospina gracilis 3/211]
MDTAYNYPRFSHEYYDFAEFPGPKPGETIPDIAVTDLTGQPVRLSDFRGQPVVLETGSVTCPIYVQEIRPMNRLAREYPDVKFLTLYVREAHPGEELHEHKDIEDKRRCAGMVAEKDGEKRQILVDDLDGNAHQKLGGFPNMVYVINAEGTVIFRGNWNHPDKVEEILKSGDFANVRHRDLYGPDFPTPYTMYRVLARGGRLAFWDLAKSIPRLLKNHKVVEQQGRRQEETHRPQPATEARAG